MVLEFLGNRLHHRERLVPRHDHGDRRALADQLGALARLDVRASAHGRRDDDGHIPIHGSSIHDASH